MWRNLEIEALETVDCLLTRGADTEVLDHHKDVAGCYSLGEVLPTFQFVKSVLAHFFDIGDREVAVMENHVGIDIVFANNPCVVGERGRSVMRRLRI